MDYGTRAISTGDKTSGRYHGNYYELDGDISGWLCLPLHSCKLILYSYFLIVNTIVCSHAKPRIAMTLCTFIAFCLFVFKQNFLYPYGTAIFIFLCAIIWLYLYLCLPETKGRSVDDITTELRQRTREKNSTLLVQNRHPDSAAIAS